MRYVDHHNADTIGMGVRHPRPIALDTILDVNDFDRWRRDARPGVLAKNGVIVEGGTRATLYESTLTSSELWRGWELGFGLRMFDCMTSALR
jgi:hypothetical protein